MVKKPRRKAEVNMDAINFIEEFKCEYYKRFRKGVRIMEVDKDILPLFMIDNIMKNVLLQIDYEKNMIIRSENNSRTPTKKALIRQCFMYTAFYEGHQTIDIAKYLGLTNHSSIIYSVKRIDSLSNNKRSILNDKLVVIILKNLKDGIRKEKETYKSVPADKIIQYYP